MTQNRLNIIPSNEETSHKKSKNRTETLRQKFDLLWLTNPEQFNPNRNAMERERISRTISLIDQFISEKNLQIADLGCGFGVLSNLLAINGSLVDGLDISQYAIEATEAHKNQNIKTSLDCVPYTRLSDEAYDLVVATEMIAYLDSQLYRLFFSEISRIVRPTGYIICSTPLDLNSEDALQRFGGLAETECKILKWVFSYHALHIRLCSLINFPKKISLISKNKIEREKEIDKRTGIKKFLYKWNSSLYLGLVWSGIAFILHPIQKYINQNRWFLIQTEKLCRFFWSDFGISHCIFIGTRRPLLEPIPQEEMPHEQKKKKTVWE